MGAADPIVVAVDLGVLSTRYPRRVGRNARLGPHGTGPMATVAVLRTDHGHAGWGLVPGNHGDPAVLVGRSVSELIGPDGIRTPGLHAFDIALHDLLGVVTDTPVAGLLGGAPGAVPVYDGAIYFDDLDDDTPGTGATPRGIETILQECRDDAAAGHTGFKLKIGRGHRWLDVTAGDRRDIEVTRAVRAAFPDAAILVDANDGYDLDRMCRYLDAVADVGLYWVEEPFGDDASRLRALRDHLDRVSPATRIADGEYEPDVASLLPMAADGSVQVLLMDVMTFGFTAWREMMPRVRGAGAEASPHAWGQPLKTLYAAHLAAGMGNIPMVEGVPGVTDGVDPSALQLVDGMLSLTDRPGFGLPVPDAEYLRAAA